MPLTEPQRELLEQRKNSRQALREALDADERIVRRIERWDAGEPDILEEADLTDAQVIGRARTALNNNRAALIAAATAILEV